jgi:hypothetical protein
MIRFDRTAASSAAPLFALPNGARDAAAMDGCDAGPAVGELADIEDEWPLIEAELAVVEAEIAVLVASDEASCEWAWRRLRRAQGRVLREAAAHASRRVVASTVGRAA